jgi:hypothetical protein
LEILIKIIELVMPIKETLYLEIEKLPEEMIPEIMDYVAFMESKSGKLELTRKTQTLSEPAFSKIWDNEEDAIYDTYYN